MLLIIPWFVLLLLIYDVLAVVADIAAISFFVPKIPAVVVAAAFAVAVAGVSGNGGKDVEADSLEIRTPYLDFHSHWFFGPLKL